MYVPAGWTYIGCFTCVNIWYVLVTWPTDAHNLNNFCVDLLLRRYARNTPRIYTSHFYFVWHKIHLWAHCTNKFHLFELIFSHHLYAHEHICLILRAYHVVWNVSSFGEHKKKTYIQHWVTTTFMLSRTENKMNKNGKKGLRSTWKICIESISLLVMDREEI